MLQKSEEVIKIIQCDLAASIYKADMDKLNYKLSIRDIGPTFYSIQSMKAKDRYLDRMGTPDSFLKEQIAKAEAEIG